MRVHDENMDYVMDYLIKEKYKVGKKTISSSVYIFVGNNSCVDGNVHAAPSECVLLYFDKCCSCQMESTDMLTLL